MPVRRRHRGEMRDLGAPYAADARAKAPGAAPDAMPSPPWRQSHYPGKAHLLRHAAEQGQLIFVRCTACRRRAVYLASDLVRFINPQQDALDPPFPCSRCRTAGHIWVECRVASQDEIGHLVIRRPGAVRQLWRTVKLGDP